MSEIDNLKSNIKVLNQNVMDLKEATSSPPGVPKLDTKVKDLLMTNRQIAKRMIMLSSGWSIKEIFEMSEGLNVLKNDASSISGGVSDVSSSLNIDALPDTSTFGESSVNLTSNFTNKASSTASGFIQKSLTEQQRDIIAKNELLNYSTSKKIDLESAHKIVYGELKYNGDKLSEKDSDYDFEKNPFCMPKDFPILIKIEENKKLLLDSLKKLRIKLGQMIRDNIQALKSIIANTIALVSAVSIFPPGTGLPVAFSAFNALIQSIKKLADGLEDLITIVDPLDFLMMMIPFDKLDAVVAPINAVLGTINTTLGLIGGVMSVVSKKQDSTAAPSEYVPPPPKEQKYIACNNMEYKLVVETNKDNAMKKRFLVYDSKSMEMFKRPWTTEFEDDELFKEAKGILNKFLNCK